MKGQPERGRFGRRIITNTIHAASGRVVALIVWLAYTPYLLSSLGAERFGLWSLFFAITGTLVAFDLGLSQATLRHVADAHARGDEESAGAFATIAVVAFVVLGLFWLALALLLGHALPAWLRFPTDVRADAGFVIVSGAIVFAIMGLATVTMAVAQGYGRFDLANAAMLAVTAQIAIGIPVVLSRGWGLRGLVMNVGLAWLVGGGVALAAVHHALPHFRFVSPLAARTRLRAALAFGGPMQLAVAGYTAHQHLDKFLLVPMVALAAVTPYELGFRVSNAAFSLVQLLLLAILPAAASLHARRKPEWLFELHQRGGRYVLAAAVLLFTPLATAADRLFEAWLGPGHGEAAMVLRGLALASAVFVAAGVATSIARGLGRTRLEAWFSLTMLATHVVLAVILIPTMGLAGALIAMVTSALLGVVVFLWRFAAMLGWPVRKTLVEPHGVPLLAAGAGALAGGAVDRFWPGGAFTGLVAVLAATAAVSLSITLATRYVRWQEVPGILARGGVRPWGEGGSG